MWQWLANSNPGHLRTPISRDSGWLIPTLGSREDIYITWQWLVNLKPGHVRTSTVYHVGVAGQFQPCSHDDICITWQWLANAKPCHMRTSISLGSGWLIPTLGSREDIYITWRWLDNSNPRVTSGHLYHVAVAGHF
jgi:hypothetical protein